mgnify:CR=1 FL=1
MDILINNAGFGGQGEFVERSLEADLSMIDLNVKALVALTHLVANDMVEQGCGKILHVGSTAGFMPGPLQATYFATKAFVNSLVKRWTKSFAAKVLSLLYSRLDMVRPSFPRRLILKARVLSKAVARRQKASCSTVMMR